MRVGGTRAFGLLAGLLAVLFAGSGSTALGAPLDDGIALYRHKKYPEARAALEPVLAADPSNAAAAYFLGMATLRAGGPKALDDSKALLARAVKIAPTNAGYLAEYAGVCLLMADRDNSLGLALEGSGDMERAIAMNPGDLAAREGLMQFYAKAPWPLGDPAKAMAMAGEIAKRDPKRGLADYRSISALFDKRGLREQALAATHAAQSLAPAGKE
jgi:tetratricopeptide (TPR) repeat protein